MRRASVLWMVVGTCVWGCARDEGRGGAESVTTPVVMAEAVRGVIRGVVRDAEGRPVRGAAVVVGHALDGTIFYGGGTTLSAVERRADEMPGVGKASGKTIGKTNTDADGAFEFAGLADGTFTLATVHPEKGVAIVGEVGSATGALQEIALDPATFVTATLLGTTFDPSWDYVNLETESPWANVQVSLRMEQSKDGAFAAGPIPKGCRWSVVQWRRNGARAYAMPVLSRPVEIGVGKKNSVEIASGDAKLNGRVIGPSDEPLADVGVMARSVNEAEGSRGAYTKADGTYEIVGLAPGEYRLDVVRHLLRTDIGCGFGPVDVRETKAVRVPAASDADSEIKVGSFVRTLQAGDEAPSFAARAVDGSEVKLSDYRGRVVLLDFWATWCGVCLADMKHIATLHEELKGSGKFAVISVSLDVDQRAVERFLARQKLPWPQLVLGPAEVNPVAKQYNATSTPTLLLIDQEGRIAAKHVPGEKLREEVMRMVGE